MEFPFVTLVGFLFISNLLCGIGVWAVSLLSTCCIGVEGLPLVKICGSAGQIIALIVACIVFWNAPDWGVLDFVARGAAIGCAAGFALTLLLKLR